MGLTFVSCGRPGRPGRDDALESKDFGNGETERDDTSSESPRLHGAGDATATATVALAASTTTASAAPGRAGRDRAALPKGPADKVTLGKTGIQVSLVGMGTGSIGSGQASNQTRLGVKEFGRVVRHALDNGVCFFDVADQYGSHVYLREALKGVPRDQYVIQTKTHATNFKDAKSHLERYRLELGVD